MADNACVAFLQWALPRIGRRWAGFRNVRGQACKRVRRRVAELGLADLDAYRQRLEEDPAEWAVLEQLCIVTISRFYRDRRVWNALRDEVLPALAEQRRGGVLRCWSVGCASGEEPYTLAMLWSLDLAPRFKEVSLRVLATDLDEDVLRRAREGVYAAGSLRELPEGWRERGFEEEGERWRVRDAFRAPVEFRRADLQRELPEEHFQLILCRNVVLTYFDGALQRETLARILTRLDADGGAFVCAPREQVPSGVALAPWRPELGIHRRSVR